MAEITDHMNQLTATEHKNLLRGDFYINLNKTSNKKVVLFVPNSQPKKNERL